MRLNRSFAKQDPPKPIDALRKLGPILLSEPIQFLISFTSAPTFSQMAEILLIDETL